jgi:hypothetical protein
VIGNYNAHFLLCICPQLKKWKTTILESFANPVIKTHEAAENLRKITTLAEFGKSPSLACIVLLLQVSF